MLTLVFKMNVKESTIKGTVSYICPHLQIETQAALPQVMALSSAGQVPLDADAVRAHSFSKSHWLCSNLQNKRPTISVLLFFIVLYFQLVDSG